MDNNNLDSLLDEISSLDGELNDNLDMDAGVDLDTSDMDDISLDELDNLEGMDMSELDFDDIDFDDVDITNLDASATSSVGEQEPQAEDMSLDDLIARAEEMQLADGEDDAADVSEESKEDVFREAADQMQADTVTSTGVFDDVTFDAMTEGVSDDAPFDSDNGGKSPYTAGEDKLDALLKASMEEQIQSGDLDDIEDISEKKAKRQKRKGERKKRKLSEIIFGEMDEDDIEEAAFFEKKKAKKKEDREKKNVERDAKREEKREAKQEKLAIKQKADGKKKEVKAEKKRAKEEAYAAELEEEKKSKKVSTPVVIIVFVLFAALGAGVVFGAKGFSYSGVIKKATDYFERQRYRLAYDEVSGVEVKKKDQELKDRIYTVMYVERLYESYENNMSLNRPDKALDALLRGLEKYDQYYDEAVELEIVEDIDVCREKILNALWNTYGITEDGAYAMLELEGQEYSQTLLTFSDQATQEEQTVLQTPTDTVVE